MRRSEPLPVLSAVLDVDRLRGASLNRQPAELGGMKARAGDVGRAGGVVLVFERPADQTAKEPARALERGLLEQTLDEFATMAGAARQLEVVGLEGLGQLRPVVALERIGHPERLVEHRTFARMVK